MQMPTWEHLHLAVMFLIFVISFIIYWKVYVYFMSAVDAVHESTVSYYAKKFFGGILVGVISVFVYIWFITEIFPHLGSDDAFKQEAKVSIPQNLNSNKQTQSQNTQTQSHSNATAVVKNSFNCGSPENISQSTVCSNSTLIKADAENFNYYKRALDKDAIQAKEIKNSMIEERDACETDAQCIYFAYEKASRNYKQILGI